jgi:hypothetical protein
MADTGCPVPSLLGQANGLRNVLDAVVGYERGEWDQAILTIEHAGPSDTTLPDAYTNALLWSKEVSSRGGDACVAPTI